VPNWIQSRPYPRGGTTAVRSSRSSSTIACSASPVAPSRKVSGSASSQAAYWACKATSTATASSQRRARLRRSAARRYWMTGWAVARAARCRACRSALVMGLSPSGNVRTSPRRRVGSAAYCGAVAPGVVAANEALAEHIPEAGLLAITSPDRLHRDWLAARARGETGIAERLLARLRPGAALVTVGDFHPATLSWLGAVAGNAIVPLGVDRFGESRDIPISTAPTASTPMRSSTPPPGRALRHCDKRNGRPTRCRTAPRLGPLIAVVPNVRPDEIGAFPLEVG